MSRLARIFGRRRGRTSGEAEVVAALRELEQTMEQVEAKLKAEVSSPRRRPPEPPRRRAEEPAPEPTPQPPPPPTGPLFAQTVELDVGPFPDFGALTAFERELDRIPGVAGVDVTRFLGDRAVVELTATGELPLLDLLHETLARSFEIEQVEREYLKITLSSE